MKKKVKAKIITTLFILFTMMFNSNVILAENQSNVNEDSKGELRYYDIETLNLEGIELSVNPEHGWYEFWSEEHQQTFVVLSAATIEGLVAGEYEKKDYITYFNKKDIVKFTFWDKNFDNNVYYGMVLENCEEAMNVEETDGKQIIGVYVKTDDTEQNKKKHNELNGKIIYWARWGLYSMSAGKSSTTGMMDQVMSLLANFFSGIADDLQRYMNDTANNIQDPETLALTAPRIEIEMDEKLNQIFQVTDDTEKDIETNTITEVRISNISNDAEGTTIYPEDTNIPIISVDVYSAGMNKIELFDINFLDMSNKNGNKVWKVISKFVRAVSHAVLYLSTVLLIIMIIWRAIMIVFSSFSDNPEKVKRSKEVIDKIVKAVALLIGIYIIITVMIGLYNMFMAVIEGDNQSQYVIRVIVNNLYAFNTNVVGYIKFLSMRVNPSGALGYSLLYFIYSLAGIAWFLFMFARMVLMAILTIIAPITAIMTLLEKTGANKKQLNGVLHFKGWFRVFIIWLWMPLIVLCMLKVLLYIM